MQILWQKYVALTYTAELSWYVQNWELIADWTMRINIRAKIFLQDFNYELLDHFPGTKHNNEFIFILKRFYMVLM